MTRWGERGSTAGNANGRHRVEKPSGFWWKVCCVCFFEVIKANNNTAKLVLVLYIMCFVLVVFLLLLINCCLAVSRIHQPDFTQKLIIYKLVQIRSQWPNASFPLSQSLDANEVVQLVNVSMIEVLNTCLSGCPNPPFQAPKRQTQKRAATQMLRHGTSMWLQVSAYWSPKRNPFSSFFIIHHAFLRPRHCS